MAHVLSGMQIPGWYVVWALTVGAVLISAAWLRFALKDWWNRQ